MKLSASGALLPTRGFQRRRDLLAEAVLPAGASIWQTVDGVIATTATPATAHSGRAGVHAAGATR